MNLPNKLTMLRAILVPVFMACALYIKNPTICAIVSVVVFAITALTDMLDGKIARKYNLVTNFGKFMDPLADKFMVFAALLVITVKSSGALQQIMIWSSAIVFLRELGVTSIRLVCANSSVGVVAASWFGKCKTVTQIVAIIVLLLEPIFILHVANTYYIASYVVVVAMLIMTIGSGIDYLKTYWGVLSEGSGNDKGDNLGSSAEAAMIRHNTYSYTYTDENGEQKEADSTYSPVDTEENK